MSSKPIRVLVVEADPDRVPTTLAYLAEITDIQVVGVVHNRLATINQLEDDQPDVLLVDLMLTGYCSIEIVRHVSNTYPQVRVLVLAPADPPHDRIILAVQAGALGYVCRDAARSEFVDAIQRVHSGEPWLPVQATYEILQESAAELEVSAVERREHLGQIVLGLIPLAAVLPAVIAFLWRDYWGDIGVRVVDLGIDPTTRVVDVVISLLFLIGIFGPLLYVGPWTQAILAWIALQPRLARAVARVRALPVGRLILNRWVAHVVLALSVLAITSLLAASTPLLLVLVLGPAVVVALLAAALDLDRDLPPFLQLPPVAVWRSFIIVGVLLLVLLIALGAELEIWGPDLREDGLHGVLVTELLGFKAQPVLVFDLSGENEPMGALYLGGTADLYVFYNPCEDTVELLSVSSSRVKFIDRVTCPPP